MNRKQLGLALLVLGLVSILGGHFVSRNIQIFYAFAAVGVAFVVDGAIFLVRK